MNNPFPTPTRQAGAAILFMIFSFGKRLLRQAWPLLLIFFFKKTGADARYTIPLYIFIGVTIFSLILSIANYFRFYFFIDGDNLVVEEGIFSRKKTIIPANRVQTVNTETPLIFRLLGAVKVDIDTAGAQNTEVSIKALTQQQALDLENYLLNLKEQILEEQTETEALVEGEENITEKPKGKLVFQLSMSTLIKSGVTQNHFRTIGVVLAIILGRLEDWREWAGLEYKDAFKESHLEDFLSNLALVAGAVISLFVLAAIYSTVYFILMYFNQKVTQTSNGLKTVSGLLTRREKSINFKKIQLLKIKTNPLKKALNIYNLRILQVTGNEMKKKDTLQLPGFTPEEAENLFQTLIPFAFPLNQDFHPVSQKLLIRRLVFLNLVTFPLIGLFTWLQLPIAVAITSFLTAYFNLSVYLSCRKLGYLLNEQFIVLRKGAIGTSYAISELSKIQAVRIEDSPFQRNNNLVTLEITNASGVMRIPFIPKEDALAIYDYLLFKIESQT